MTFDYEVKNENSNDSIKSFKDGLKDILDIMDALKNLKIAKTKALIPHNFLGKSETWLKDQQDVGVLINLFFSRFSTAFTKSSSSFLQLFSFQYSC